MIHSLLHWLWFHTGLSSGNSPWYLFPSGTGADFQELAIIGFLYAFVRKHNCHEHRCWRLGRYQVADGQYTTCRKHHPDPVIRTGVHAHHIRAAYEAHAKRHAS